METFRIVVEANSGHLKPWSGRVYLGERFIGKTGFCATAYGAQRCAERIQMRESQRMLIEAQRVEVAR